MRPTRHHLDSWSGWPTLNGPVTDGILHCLADPERRLEVEPEAAIANPRRAPPILAESGCAPHTNDGRESSELTMCPGSFTPCWGNSAYMSAAVKPARSMRPWRPARSRLRAALFHPNPPRWPRCRERSTVLGALTECHAWAPRAGQQPRARNPGILNTRTPAWDHSGASRSPAGMGRSMTLSSGASGQVQRLSYRQDGWYRKFRSMTRDRPAEPRSAPLAVSSRKRPPP